MHMFAESAMNARLFIKPQNGFEIHGAWKHFRSFKRKDHLENSPISGIRFIKLFYSKRNAKLALIGKTIMLCGANTIRRKGPSPPAK